MLTLRDVANNFSNVKQNGAGFTAACPICEVGDPKGHHIYINLATDGKSAVISCQKSGCSAADAGAALGLAKNYFYFDSDEMQKEQPREQRAHIYYNADGSEYGRKIIVKPGKNGRGKDAFWKYPGAGKPGRQPLYNLPELIKADFAELPIYIPEGEKDCDTISKMGLLATSLPNGGGQTTWRDHWSDTLKDRDIIVLTDNDDTGKEYGEFIERHLRTVAKTLRIVPTAAIYSDIQPKGDITDVAEKIGVEAARTALQRATDEAKNLVRSAFDAFNFYSVSQLTEAEKKPPEFIIDGIIPVGLTFISGAPKIRKSFLALQMAIAVANGTPFLGHSTTRCEVAYFDLEGSKSRVSSRTDRMGAAVPDTVHITNDCPATLADGLTAQLKALHRCNKNIRLVIVDTYSRARGTVKTGGANAYDSDVQLLEPIQRMAISEKIAVVFVHHDRKGAGFFQDSFERLSGTMGISGSADSVLNLVADGKRSDGRATLEYNPRDCKGGEMKLSFNEVTLTWEIDALNPDSIENDRVIQWILQNAKPEAGKSGVFLSYSDAYLRIFGHDSDAPHVAIKKAVAKHNIELLTSSGIIIQTAAKVNDARGIRVINISN